MIKKVFVKGPMYSQSGYGQHARMIIRALRSREDLFDVYIQPIKWGLTGWIWEDDDERRYLDQTLQKTVAYIQSGGRFDISVQVTIPGEFEKIAPINIGVTAGIETTKVSAQWIEKCNMMDKVIVPSEFAKWGFDNTVYETIDSASKKQLGTLSCKTPIEVVSYPVRDDLDNVVPSEHIKNLDFPGSDFNFLMVAQWSPRKNIENTVKWFVEEFIDNENVGLILKINKKDNSEIDKFYVRRMIDNLLSEYGERKCKIYYLHGDMSEADLHNLYLHPKIKALYNIAHGECFGLPMFEAAYQGLPVVTVNWGGQLDFLNIYNKEKKKNEAFFARVSCNVAPIQKEVYWENILIPDSMWAFADSGSVKMQLRKVYKEYGIYQGRAGKLKKHLREKLSLSNINKQACLAIGGEEKSETANIAEWLAKMNVKEFK